jgi:hypothetical protein
MFPLFSQVQVKTFIVEPSLFNQLITLWFSLEEKQRKKRIEIERENYKNTREAADMYRETEKKEIDQNICHHKNKLEFPTFFSSYDEWEGNWGKGCKGQKIVEIIFLSFNKK